MESQDLFLCGESSAEDLGAAKEIIDGLTVYTVPSKLTDDANSKTVAGAELENIANQICCRKTVDPDTFLVSGGAYEPVKDYSDLGQAEVFADEFGKVVRYAPGVGFVVYDGVMWQESEELAQGLSQKLTERQKQESSYYVRFFAKKKTECIVQNDGKASDEINRQYQRATEYCKFVGIRRQTTRVNAVLKESKPKLYIKTEYLDMFPFKLNTPTGTVDLTTGVESEHSPDDFITKCTSLPMSDKGMDVFKDFLHQITCGDPALEDYLQEIAGMFLVGKVFTECFVIAYGSGGNGKSTYFNLLGRVLGTYAGSIPSDMLIQRKNANQGAELAELRGKRLIISSELDEGEPLDTGLMKKICSTDPINANPKYHKPFDFIPTHSAVLFTNHLPKVSSNDDGTWDRLVVIPFQARFRNKNTEIKNYADYLYDTCGESVLKWMVEGAVRFVKDSYKIEKPECVRSAIEEYRKNSDWVFNFVADCCEKAPAYETLSSKMYGRYKHFCEQNSILHPKSIREFNKAFGAAGFGSKHTNHGAVWIGVKLVEEN